MKENTHVDINAINKQPPIKQSYKLKLVVLTSRRQRNTTIEGKTPYVAYSTNIRIEYNKSIPCELTKTHSYRTKTIITYRRHNNPRSNHYMQCHSRCTEWFCKMYGFGCFRLGWICFESDLYGFHSWCRFLSSSCDDLNVSNCSGTAYATSRRHNTQQDQFPKNLNIKNAV